MALKDYLPSYLNERARSPLYGSFIISWLIWNWRIVFAILFFKREDLHGDNLNDFIYYHYVNTGDTILYPLLVALLYIYFLPVIDLRLIKYAEEQKREKIDEKIRIGRRHCIEGDTYYDLKLDFEKEKKKVIDFDKERKKYEAEIIEKDNTIKSRDAQVANFIDLTKRNETQLTNLLNRHDIEKFFRGRWFRKLVNGQQIEEEEIQIIGNEYRVIDRLGVAKLAYLIELPDVDIENKKLTFLKFSAENEETSRKPISMVELNMLSNDRYEGFENKRFKVTYIKREFRDPREGDTSGTV